jgi:Sec-independent protein translocase protein TatA
MGIFTHWYVLVIVLAVALLLLGPSILPRVGRRLGRRVRETRDAGAATGKAFKEAAAGTGDPDREPRSESEPGPPRN